MSYKLKPTGKIQNSWLIFTEFEWSWNSMGNYTTGVGKGARETEGQKRGKGTTVHVAFKGARRDSGSAVK